MTPKAEEALLEELVAIRKLLVFALLRDGTTQAQIAAALGIAQSQVSGMFPKGIASAIKPKVR